jgi:hypothetical protein
MRHLVESFCQFAAFLDVRSELCVLLAKGVDLSGKARFFFGEGFGGDVVGVVEVEDRADSR